MPYFDRHKLNNAPYPAVVYYMGEDTTKPLDEREENVEIVVAEFMCDIQQNSHTMERNNIKAEYSVYVPIDSATAVVNVRRGHLFRAEQNGVHIVGSVAGVFPSQLDGVTMYIKVNSEDKSSEE